MRILLTNNTLDRRAGTELYVLDVARELQKRGHQPVAFSQRQGDVAASLRACGVPVVDDPRKMGAPPDVIHGQHHIETLIALTSFPGVPAVSFCHGWAPWQEEPLRFPRVLRYVAVDQPCWEKLVLENGIPADKVQLLFNFVDMERFPRRSALPRAPRRALAFGNYFSPGPAFETLRNACLRSGIQLDAAGMSCGNPHPAPERLLPGYDLVFAKARSALEAMAVGAAVILCGPEGLGPLACPGNWSELRRLNFGFRTLNLPYTEDELSNQIRRYDAEAATEVRDLVRSEATLIDAVDRLCGLYEEVVREGTTITPHPAAENAAVAQYMLRWVPRYKQWELASDRKCLIAQVRHAENETAETRSELARTLEELDSARDMLKDARNESSAAQAAITAEVFELRSRHAAEVSQARQQSDAMGRALNERIASLIAERDDWRGRHDEISRSATWRLSNLVLQSRAVRAVAMPLVERAGRFLRRSLPERGGRPVSSGARRPGSTGQADTAP
jgi:hypothetical protein